MKNKQNSKFPPNEVISKFRGLGHSKSSPDHLNGARPFKHKSNDSLIIGAEMVIPIKATKLT